MALQKRSAIGWAGPAESYLRAKCAVAEADRPEGHELELDEFRELHYITPIANVVSMLTRGILSHNAVAGLPHESVAMAEIQEKREGKVVPGGMPLHDYANLYLCARNPMMYRRRELHATLCVLRISTNVLYLTEAAITSGNASSKYTRFAPSPSGLSLVDRDLVFAEYWTDPDEVAGFRKKSAKCAEVLVPHRVPPEFILGAYVSCQAASRAAGEQAPHLSIATDAHLFFRAGG